MRFEYATHESRGTIPAGLARLMRGGVCDRCRKGTLAEVRGDGEPGSALCAACARVTPRAIPATRKATTTMRATPRVTPRATPRGRADLARLRAELDLMAVEV